MNAGSQIAQRCQEQLHPNDEFEPFHGNFLGLGQYGTGLLICRLLVIRLRISRRLVVRLLVSRLLVSGRLIDGLLGRLHRIAASAIRAEAILIAKGMITTVALSCHDDLFFLLSLS